MSLATDTINKFRTNKQLHNDLKGDFDKNEVNVLNLVGKNQFEENSENVPQARRGTKRKKSTLGNPYTYKQLYEFYRFCGFVSDDLTESYFQTKCSRLLNCMGKTKFYTNDEWLNESAFPLKKVPNTSSSPKNINEAIFEDFSKNKQVTDELKKTLVQKDILLENSIKESELLKSRLESSESEHRLRMDEKIAIISFLDREQKQINHRLGQAKKTENRLRTELDTRREEGKSLQIQAVSYQSQLKSLQEEKEIMAAQLTILQDQLSQYIIRSNVLEETNKSLEETNKSLEDTNKNLEETNKSLEETNKSLEEELVKLRTENSNCLADKHQIRNANKSALVNDLDKMSQEIRMLEEILNEKMEETAQWKKEFSIKKEQVEQMNLTVHEMVVRRARLETERGDFDRRYDEIMKENEELQAQIEDKNDNKDSEILNLHSKLSDLKKERNDFVAANDLLKKRIQDELKSAKEI